MLRARRYFSRADGDIYSVLPTVSIRNGRKSAEIGPFIRLQGRALYKVVNNWDSINSKGWMFICILHYLSLLSSSLLHFPCTVDTGEVTEDNLFTCLWETNILLLLYTPKMRKKEKENCIFYGILWIHFFWFDKISS